MSDTHAKVGGGKFLPFVVPDGDVLLHAGDFTDLGSIPEIIAFNDWLGTLPHKHKVVIAGNRDLAMDVDWLNGSEGAKLEKFQYIQHPDLEKVIGFNISLITVIKLKCILS
jgi:hypothetical protein